MSVQLDITRDGLRARLGEPDWAAVAAATSTTSRGALAPLEPASTTTRPDESLVAAAALALGAGPIHVELLTGSGEHGLVAQIGCDAVAAGVAVRALVVPHDAGGPVAAPGVEVSANTAANVVAEIMRLFPAEGLTRHVDASPVTLHHEQSLVLHRAARSGDDRLARLVAEQAGLGTTPDLLVSLARGTTASATATIRVAGSPTTVVQQWLLCDVGWVLLTVRGTRVTHTAQSRDEVGATFVRLLAGAFATAGTVADGE